ncbi:MAG: SDR family NAD(P)-dependent oxidoreductase [Cyanobacteria bacterium K_DeepCast_35m_m2_023]|nr:SDR family NAD(P)-dependent oxidoreductase [Cyanobacteria bacterium K_DeepCast_35m_m2_023]
MTVQADSTSGLNASATVKLLVLGGGYCGSRLAQAAARQGLAGLMSQRRPQQAPPPPPGWQTIGFDTDSGLVPSLDALAGVTHVLSTIAPGSDGRDPVLATLGGHLGALRPHWLGYLSTTGVYGNSAGAWVDEQSPCQPGVGRSRARLACEQAWQSLGLPLQIFRLPAIYGPGRNPFAELRAGRGRLVHRPGQVFCRVHVDDICGALLHCMALEPQRRPLIVNISDDVPCPSSEQLGYAAHLLGCPLPPLQRFEQIEASMSPMARSFWLDNRRVSNALLCSTLGYRLRYPSYREGLRASLAEEEEGAAGAQSPFDGSGSAT